jgi:hypothetical protein
MIKSRKTDLTYADAKKLGGVFNLVSKWAHSGDFLLFAKDADPLYYNLKGPRGASPIDNPDSLKYFSKQKYRPSKKNIVELY